MTTADPASASSTSPAPAGSRRRTGMRSAVIGVLSLIVLAVPLLICACGAQVEGDVTVAGPPGPPGAVVVAQDEYDYYPAYGVYFNPYRGQYYYQENGAWVNRPAPPGVSVDVLLASPRVHTDFHDHPQFHHEDMVRRYPRTYHAPEREPERR